MGVDLNCWRARIGCFMQPRKHKQFKQAAMYLGKVKASVWLRLTFLFMASAAIAGQPYHEPHISRQLLQCGDIESQPGPPKANRLQPVGDKRETRQTRLNFSQNAGGQAQTPMHSATAGPMGGSGRGGANADVYPQDIYHLVLGLKEDIKQLREENKILRNRLERVERKDNLIIHGIPETPDDGIAEQAVTFLKDNLNIDVDIDFAQRLGKTPDDTAQTARPNGGSAIGPSGGEAARVEPEEGEVTDSEDTQPAATTKPRPVLVKLNSFAQRSQILSEARRTLKGKPEKVFEDFGPRTREARRKLIPYLIDFRRRNPDEKTFLRYDKLVHGKQVFDYDPDTENIKALETNHARE